MVVQVINNKTKITSPMSRAQWDKISADPQWRGVFKLVEVTEPPEVKALRERQASKNS